VEVPFRARCPEGAQELHMSDTIGSGPRPQAADAGANLVHEAYSFACMNCGHGWEQAYEIEHHTDAAGHDFIIYKADGVHVPSPLSRLTCRNCGEHKVRIMRAGQVSSVSTNRSEKGSQ
jgi:Zn finger protein HypA/HybF involved in hydrogenase expression